MSRKEGGSELASIEDCVNLTIQRLKYYPKESGQQQKYQKNLRTNKKTKNIENRNGKKNNCTDTSSGKLRKLSTRWTRKRILQKRNWFGERDETVNHLRREFSKLALKEYKSKHDWSIKMIHWELCKWLKLNHVDKWYMHKPESLQEN